MENETNISEHQVLYIGEPYEVTDDDRIIIRDIASEIYKYTAVYTLESLLNGNSIDGIILLGTFSGMFHGIVKYTEVYHVAKSLYLTALYMTVRNSPISVIVRTAIKLYKHLMIFNKYSISDIYKIISTNKEENVNILKKAQQVIINK